MVGENNTEIETAEENLTDKYGHEILPRQMFFKGNYLERVVTKRNHQTFKKNAHQSFLSIDQVLFCVKFTCKIQLHETVINELCEVIVYLEQAVTSSTGNFKEIFFRFCFMLVSMLSSLLHIIRLL